LKINFGPRVVDSLDRVGEIYSGILVYKIYKCIKQILNCKKRLMWYFILYSKLLFENIHVNR